MHDWCLSSEQHKAVQVSCVSGAQLSNYATFLVHPEQAALSIVLTALSTASGVALTPLLVLLLLGQRIPIDVQGMAASITQIVILPVGIGEITIIPNCSGTLSIQWLQLIADHFNFGYSTELFYSQRCQSSSVACPLHSTVLLYCAGH